MRLGFPAGASGGSIVTSAVAATLFEVDMRGRENLAFSLSPATQNLTALTVDAKVNVKDTAWQTLASAGADFTTPNRPVYDASGAIPTQAAASTGWACIENKGWAAMRVTVTGAAAPGTCGFSYHAQ